VVGGTKLDQPQPVRASLTERLGTAVGVAGAILSIAGACWLRYIAVTFGQLAVGIAIIFAGLPIMAVGFVASKRARRKANAGSTKI
jgi:hypothetical protein